MVFGEIGKPVPKAGEVLIANRAAALNFFEILRVQGKYQERPELPWVPGAEVAGIVDAVGEGVAKFKPGDRAYALPFLGGFADYTIASELNTFPMPGGMTFSEAAAFPLIYQTSYFALKDRARLKAGEWLLVHAGASGVGMAAIQLGKAWGANVIATAGSPEKIEFARQQGAAHVLSYADGSWVDEVKRITGRGADVIYDPVGGDVFDLSSKCIAPYGRLLVVGFASGRIPAIAANRILLKNMSVVGVLWGNHAKAFENYTAETQHALSELYLAGSIRPRVSASYRLEELVEGFRALATRRVLGKIVVEIGTSRDPASPTA
jgi:NADPH2:quinone reductase